MISTILPSPKLVTGTSAERARWYRFYAMFSESFAREVLKLAGLKRGSNILDPWIGAGTTTAVAAANFNSVGIDINPVMVAVSRGRTINQQTARRCIDVVCSVVETAKPLLQDDPLREWFGPQTAAAVRRWARAVQFAFPSEQCPEEAGFLFTVLFETAQEMGKPYRSKNPTWPKKPNVHDRVNLSASRVRQLVLATAREKVNLCLPGQVGYSPQVRLGSSTQIDFPDGFFDFVLTSPPYCTRIDYAVGTGIELGVLGFPKLDLAILRQQTMGTSAIRSVQPRDQTVWGATCNRFIATVWEHPSKSSQSYYYKTYLQYFDDLWQSLREITRCVRSRGQMVIVVQDSVYKGIKVDLPQIITEMSQQLGWDVVRRCDFPASRNMRQVNTRSRGYLRNSATQESVLWFSKRD